MCVIGDTNLGYRRERMERIESRRNADIQKELMEMRRQKSEAALANASLTPLNAQERFLNMSLHHKRPVLQHEYDL